MKVYVITESSWNGRSSMEGSSRDTTVFSVCSREETAIEFCVKHTSTSSYGSRYEYEEYEMEM